MHQDSPRSDSEPCASQKSPASRELLSSLGQQLAAPSGIDELMNDLGEALAAGGENYCFMGGGNPAAIAAVNAVWRRELERIMTSPADQPEGGQLERILGNYDAAAGNPAFLEALAELLAREYGWQISVDNLAVTNGAQTALFLLFNLLCGDFADGSKRKVLLPLVPEYIGYSDQGLSSDLFESLTPAMELLGQREFKYHLALDKLEQRLATQAEEIGLLCVSRPTNPTGNVITDAELAQLDALARKHAIPLLIDGAYGTPFPQILFEQVRPHWNENTILTLSLSKLGLPGMRTGIVVARPEIIQALRRSVSVTSLANSNLGQAIVTPLLQSGKLLELCSQHIQPYYQARAKQCLRWAEELLPAQVPWRVHKSEGALFLWFWFQKLPISSQELYQRLKRQGVIVVPGEHFFFGLGSAELENWPHSRQCIRVSFSAPEVQVREGLRRLGLLLEEVYSLQ